MNKLIPQDLPNFARQFKFAGARLLRVKQAYRKGQLVVDVFLRLMPAIKNLDDDPRPVRLHLRLVGVDEMRILKRPAGSPGKVPDAHFGYFQSQFFITLDSWSLQPGERAGVHDFRGSDLYFGCRDLLWEQVEKPTKPE
ncbi:hypothetical protein [Limnoglobus roseus]|uniref:Uncharacterized protein n=1 Tax=Limnoglobus roseus TaxID=2598579 RepID=A0A5C1AQ31_9BACT|nr:hypothetical protein [Limnoglobus roseus]QEL20287.1 hypothetical protein PX52LOC_07379 [Limnoglobus roseus]